MMNSHSSPTTLPFKSKFSLSFPFLCVHFHDTNSIAQRTLTPTPGSYCWHPSASALNSFCLQTLWRSKYFDDKAPLLRPHQYVRTLGSPLIFSSNTRGVCLFWSMGWVPGSVHILFIIKIAETQVQGIRGSRLEKAAPTHTWTLRTSVSPVGSELAILSL